MSEKWEAVCLDDKKYTSRIDVKTDKIEIALRAGVHWAIATNKEKQKDIHRIVKLAAAAPEMLKLLKEYCDPKIRNPINMVKLLQKTEGLIEELEGE